MPHIPLALFVLVAPLPTVAQRQAYTLCEVAALTKPLLWRGLRRLVQLAPDQIDSALELAQSNASSEDPQERQRQAAVPVRPVAVMGIVGAVDQGRAQGREDRIRI